MSTDEMLMRETLFFSFNLVIFSVNQYGEQKERSIKLTRAKFLKRLDFDYKVKLVDDYPKDILFGIFYVKKNGRTVWYKEKV